MPIYVTFYKNDTVSTNVIAVDAIEHQPMYNGDVFAFSFTIKNLSDYAPFSSLWISINDSSGIYPYQAQCLVDGRFEIDAVMLFAEPDTMNVYCPTPTIFDVFANDAMIHCDRNAINLSITGNSKVGAGTSVNANKDIVYNRATNFAGLDTLEYEAICHDTVYWAKVLITVDTTQPILTQPASVALCSGFSTSLISFGGTNVDPAKVKWAVTSGSGTAIGMSANSGTGSIQPFMTTNSGSASATVTITVTPVSAGECEGIPKIFTITVKPTMVPSVTISATPN
jgi:hypothetical protein